MGGHHNCDQCGKYYKGEDPWCNCANNTTKRLIEGKIGALILDTLYDDFDQPFVWLVEKLKLRTGTILCMKTYIGTAGGEYDPVEKLRVVSCDEFDRLQKLCIERDQANQNSDPDDNENCSQEDDEVEDLFTFVILDRVGKTRQGTFQRVFRGEEDQVDRVFTERQMTFEKEKLLKSGWEFNPLSNIWSKNNSAHKKRLRAMKHEDQPTEQEQVEKDAPPELKETGFVCGYKVQSRSPVISTCTAHRPEPVVCTKVPKEGLCAAHRRGSFAGVQ